jgi:signal transduction histidine kinase
MARRAPSAPTPPPAARGLLAFRLVLAGGALAVLGALPWADLIAGLDPGGPLDGEGPGIAAGILPALFCLVLTAACRLTLNYPGRRDVALVALPAAVAGWALGSPAATLITAVGALAGNALRRLPPMVVVSGAARLTLATAAGLAVARPFAPTPAVGASPLAPQIVLAGIAFFVTFTLVDLLLDRAETGLAGAPTDAARSDPLTNAALFPMALLLAVAGYRFGYEPLAFLLAGLVCLLWVVRTTVNLRTLHGALERLHADVAEEREKLATLFEQSGEGIYTVDDSLRVTSLNPAMAALLGLPAAQVAGRACADVCHFLDGAGQPLCPDRCPLRRAHAAGHSVTEEVRYTAPGGPDPAPAGAAGAAGAAAPGADPATAGAPPRQKHLLLTYTAAGEPGDPLRLGIGIARDVSDLKEAERLRSDFVSLVTHELRSPLTISTGYVSLLRRALQASYRPQDTDAGRVWRYLDRIENAEQHLLRLVNSLLEMARLERTDLPVDYTAVPVHQRVEDAVEATVPAAAERGLTLERDIPADLPNVWSSELYLQEIVSNLLSNAVKYTPPGGHIRVQVAVDAVDGAADAAGLPPPAAPRLRIAVADTGYGLTDEEQAKLFTRFFRSQRPEVRREPGTGLGLAFTRQMVERIDGTIAVTSVPGEGSTFTVSFPLRPAAAAAHPDGAPAGATGAPDGAVADGAPPDPARERRRDASLPEGAS